MNLVSFLRFISIILIFAIAVWLQTHTIISGDITWLMHVGQRFLAGGQYYKNFIEVNPPMAIYIYLIPVLLSQYLSISFISSITIYIFVIISFTWLISCWLIKKIFTLEDKVIRYIFEIILAFTFFIMPAYAFGQREHLLVLLTFPYLLLAALRLQGHIISPSTASAIGFMAGIGFAIKPFFILAWLFIEIYIVLRTKRLTAWVRGETITCLSIFVLYAFSIVFLTPAYLAEVKNLIAPVYYLNFQMPLILLVTNPLCFISLSLLIFYIFIRKQLRYQQFTDLLALNVIAMLLCFFLQKTLWFYHFLPVFMYMALLLALIFLVYAKTFNIFSVVQINFQFGINLLIYALSLILATILFSLTIKTIHTSFYITRNLFNNPIYTLVKSMRGKSIYIFATNIDTNYPLIDYAGTNSPSAFPCLWIIQAAHKLAELAPKQQAQANKIADYARHLDINNIINNKPVLILVQLKNLVLLIPKGNHWDNTTTLVKAPATDFLGFFLQDKKFVKFWQDYQYQGQIEDFAIYKLKTS